MSPSQQWKENEQRIIRDFFRTKVPSYGIICSEEDCLQYIHETLGIDDAIPVENQGANSFTLVSPSKSTIIQFRLKPFNTETLLLASHIYGDQVPNITPHLGFPLPVYTSNVIPGKVHVLQEFPDPFPLQRQLNTVTDLAKFIAKATYFPQIQSTYKIDSWTRRSSEHLQRLQNNASLRQLAPELLPLIERIQSNIYLLDSLPPVLTHHDFSELNILADTHGHLTGVIDFDSAAIEPLGVCIWGIYECFLGSTEQGHWSFFDQAADGHPGKSVREVLEASFWETLWSSVAPGVETQTEHVKEAVRVATRIGVIERYFVDGMLDAIDTSRRVHRYSLAYARGILPAV